MTKKNFFFRRIIFFPSSFDLQQCSRGSSGTRGTGDAAGPVADFWADEDPGVEAAEAAPAAEAVQAMGLQ